MKKSLKILTNDVMRALSRETRSFTGIERVDIYGWTIFRVVGDIEENMTDSLRLALRDCIQDGQVYIIIDMKATGFVGYMAVGVMVNYLRQCRALGGDLKLSNVNLYTQRLFRMVGVDKVFESYSSEEEARLAFSSPLKSVQKTNKCNGEKRAG